MTDATKESGLSRQGIVMGHALQGAMVGELWNSDTSNFKRGGDRLRKITTLPSAPLFGARWLAAFLGQ